MSYGTAFSKYPHDDQAAVIVVSDLDDKDLATFCAELMAILNACAPRPNAVFCLAIEEGEAWLLGDIASIKKAYPNARERILSDYVNDSICGTWERLADAIFPGGAPTLSRQAWQSIGAEKYRWALNITPHMDFASNKSPSFNGFRDRVRALLGLVEKTA